MGLAISHEVSQLNYGFLFRVGAAKSMEARSLRYMRFKSSAPAPSKKPPPICRPPVRPGHRQMEAGLVGEDEAATVEPLHPAAECLPVGFDPLGGREAFFYAAGRAAGAPGRRSRDALRLWPSSSDTRRVLPASRRGVIEPAL
jgi:hypothetical protein